MSTTAFEWLRDLTERSKRYASASSIAQPLKAEGVTFLRAIGST